jgi:uncharacterized protein YacL (UPF0231 family)
MKTAMQELIEWCNSCLTDLTLSDGAKTALEVTMVRANDLLEKEKEQIINAHGLKYYDIGEVTITGENYYNQIYNQNNNYEIH